jgi:DNA-binding MarR family transcriptional regulator
MAPEAAALRDADFRALARFRHLIRRFLAFSEEAARRSGLQPQQHQLLLAVKGLPQGMAPSIGALAWQLQLRHHSVVELANRLTRLGHAVRRRNPADHREVWIGITPRGHRVLRKLSVIHRQELRRAAPELLPALAVLFATSPVERIPTHDGPPRRPSHPGRSRR